MPSRKNLINTIKFLVLVNLLLLQQFLPALTITALPNNTDGSTSSINPVPEIAFVGYKSLSERNAYTEGLRNKTCNSYNNSRVVAWEWKLTTNPVQPVTYTVKLIRNPYGISSPATTTASTHDFEFPRANGTYIIEVYATDANGNRGKSKSCAFTQDDKAPHANWITPTNSQVISGVVKLSAKADDNMINGIAQVEFSYKPIGTSDSQYQNIQTVTKAPYDISADTTKVRNGNYTLKVTARDKAGLENFQTIDVTVANN